MRRLLAIIVSPLAGCLGVAIAFIIFFGAKNKLELSTLVYIHIYIYFISLIIQISLVETCLYIYSAFWEVNLKTYLGVAVIYSLAFTIYLTQITLLEPDVQPTLFDTDLFVFVVAYSLANIFCYYHLFFKHQENNHENV
ncbi:hypothetical protein VB264_23810 [Arcicella aquatica]|uniref:Uncharacterized protein n=1 Tax=Arcicella aquatica TaxID=217141 RepID=A0ABU5QUS6_9BACT|nr:hypothetical protein [Arcicella aquatica]MEA5260846.1 hypothetical protein [Arcicella aquatica]